MYDHGQTGYQTLSQSRDYFSVLSGVESVLYVLTFSNPLVFSCKQGLFESKAFVDAYRTGMTQGSIFQFNLFYNLGSMLTSLRNIFYYFAEIEYTRVKTSFEMGYELGTMFWYLFYPSEEYI